MALQNLQRMDPVGCSQWLRTTDGSTIKLRSSLGRKCWPGLVSTYRIRNLREGTMQEGATGNYRQKDYWVVQNRQYAEPSFRLHKCARMLKELANGQECALLDVGCGPGALRQVLPLNIKYHGIDIALQEPAGFMREVDFAKNPISYDGRRFDFIVALGVLEYMGTLQNKKFQEIKDILNQDGKFIMSYR